MLVCEQHYDGAKHNRKIAVELEKFHQARRALYLSDLLYTSSHVGHLCIFLFHFNDNQFSFFHAQENPKEPMPKRIGKGGGGPTPTITGQTESFLAAYPLFVTTITTAGCVKNSVKCKIFQLERERNCFDIASTKCVVLQNVCTFTHSV